SSVNERATPRVLSRRRGALFAALLSTQARPVLAGECTRPTDPGGAGGYDYGDLQPSSFGNAQVLVWYTTTGAHAVNSASSRSDGVPDDVATVAAVTRDALSRYAAMGFRAPLSDDRAPSCGSNGGDARFDVYLLNMRGADGMAVPESGRCASVSPKQCASYLVAKSNYAEYYDSAELGIRTVLPHETFHAVQNAYDADLDRFWAEGSAQWAAKTLDPTLRDLERNLPAFFSQSARSLDAPPSGVTAAFLYGSAIWPVFLSQRFGDDIVRSVLEEEAQQGDSAITATAAVLRAMQSSIADEFPLFAAWNAATGARAGTGGYLNAMDYPEVDVSELNSEGSKAITSGLASFYYHAQTAMPMQLTLDTDSARNRGLLVPFADGLPRIDQLTPLPAELNGEGIVVVSGITTSKKDAPFTVSLSAPSSAQHDAIKDSGGCSLSARAPAARFLSLFAVLGVLAWIRLRTSRTRRASCARVAGAVGTPSPSPR
ncbi:MAG TPA: MXAN_6640 family putative metalloprotease, partial [Polyangiaceae bacterium]